MKDPTAPTRQERLRHELTHVPFRPWCPECVAGQAADNPHRSQHKDDDDGIIKVSVDYGFVAALGDEEARVLLVCM